MTCSESKYMMVLFYFHESKITPLFDSAFPSPASVLRPPGGRIQGGEPRVPPLAVGEGFQREPPRNRFPLAHFFPRFLCAGKESGPPEATAGRCDRQPRPANPQKPESSLAGDTEACHSVMRTVFPTRFHSDIVPDPVSLGTVLIDTLLPKTGRFSLRFCVSKRTVPVVTVCQREPSPLSQSPRVLSMCLCDPSTAPETCRNDGSWRLRPSPAAARRQLSRHPAPRPPRRCAPAGRA